jgi:hypothetical protein
MSEAMEAERVEMTCMTTKQKFFVTDPPVIVLANGRYAYRVECPWAGKSGQPLYAFKFCSKAAFDRSTANADQSTGETEAEDPIGAEESGE